MHKRLLRSGRRVASAVVLATAAGIVRPPTTLGYTPDSPKVKAAVAKAIQFLESEDATDHPLGARSLVGMTLVKTGALPDHPRILKAIETIDGVLKERDPTKIVLGEKAIYEVGLAIMFLTTLDPQRHRAEIELFLKYLQLRQKDHGGWGYPTSKSGDTSMTQYGVLCIWEATQAGFDVPLESIEKVASWQLRTQDPGGGFGYQGRLSASFTPLKQDTPTLSMGAAGLGSLYICADLLGLIEQTEGPKEDLPPAMTRVKLEQPAKDAVKPRTQLEPRLFQEAQGRALGWLGRNYRIDPPGFTHYYLYTLERCMSFQELAQGKTSRKEKDWQEGPRWYNDGVEYLTQTQRENGSWKSTCGKVPDTAFGVLFLIRSTKKSIAKARNFGDGTLVGGRGLPKATGRVQLRGGQVVARPLLGPAEQLLDVLENLENTETPDYSQAADLLAELPPQEAEALMENYGEKLRRLAGDESPEARLAAVRALSKTRNLDNVPTLIYALSDPDPAIVVEARDALRRISRNPAGFGLSSEPNGSDVRTAIEKWKAWYLAVRPDAEFEN